MGMIMRIAGTGPPVPPCEFWGLNAGRQTWWQAPVPLEPLAGPRFGILSGSGSGQMANGLPENLISKT